MKGITRLTDQADAGRKSRPRQKQRGGEGAGAEYRGLTRLPFHCCALEAKNQVISLI